MDPIKATRPVSIGKWLQETYTDSKPYSWQFYKFWGHTNLKFEFTHSWMVPKKDIHKLEINTEQDQSRTIETESTTHKQEKAGYDRL
jgi:hypothetical protein